MGDFPESSPYGCDAALFLEERRHRGVLPAARRRPPLGGQAGPARRPSRRAERGRARAAQDRGGAWTPARNSMLSSFSVRSRLAARMVAGRTALIGDAAHEISPIGGQGMNLGWLDAESLLPAILAVLRGGPSAAALRALRCLPPPGGRRGQTPGRGEHGAWQAASGRSAAGPEHGDRPGRCCAGASMPSWPGGSPCSSPRHVTVHGTRLHSTAQDSIRLSP